MYVRKGCTDEFTLYNMITVGSFITNVSVYFLLTCKIHEYPGDHVSLQHNENTLSLKYAFGVL